MAAWRFFRDPGAPWWPKLLLVLAVVYVVSPIDLIPDLAVIVGWLDDLGVVGLTAALLGRYIAGYRGGGPPPGAEVIEAEGEGVGTPP